MENTKNIKLRIVWIIPNVFCYLMFLGFSTFISMNAEGLREMPGLFIGWIFMMLVLLLVSIFGSYRIWTWIKEGKM